MERHDHNTPVIDESYSSDSKALWYRVQGTDDETANSSIAFSTKGIYSPFTPMSRLLTKRCHRRSKLWACLARHQT
ncbi:hypothetical protein [Moorena sp. SIO4A5]|uniref:hypothetical protein n=1 Tax=Moorena sp. SIO4A5 TaxID=2607838 RepID=UPI0013C79835|nr:hypothetical protein [Moorena sp. SIO4A5]NEO20735.1 hypothetical protein [Moorena sp. SIO4A5]